MYFSIFGPHFNASYLRPRSTFSDFGVGSSASLSILPEALIPEHLFSQVLGGIRNGHDSTPSSDSFINVT